MKGYAYEIRRYRLCRFAGALPRHPPIYMTPTGDTGQLVDHGMMDRATPETRDLIEGQLARLAATTQGPARFRVEWLRRPRGPHAGLFRGLQRDVVTDAGLDPGTAIVLWVGLCIAVGLLANRYGRPWFNWIVLSLLISPLLGFVFLLAVGRKAGADRPTA